MSRKQQFLLLLFLLVSVNLVQANMASPNIHGYTPALVLQSKDVDIEHEDLAITLSDTTTAANYFVRYQINNEKEEGKLALIFDAIQPYSEFKVLLDGNSIELLPTLRDSISILTDTLQYGSNYVLFTLDISKGKHTIEVYYKGYPSEFLGNWVTQYTHTYNLEPAKSWKSFGNLKLTINASTVKDPVCVEIQDSTYQLQGISHTWLFDTIPQDLIQIRFLPKGDLPFMIYPEAIFLFVFIGLFILNLWWSIRWRKAHLCNKYSLPAILGALIVPLLSIAAYLFSYPLVDWLIGKYAASFHGYVFLVIFIYPFFAVIYFIVLWIIDHFYKRIMRNK